MKQHDRNYEPTARNYDNDINIDIAKRRYEPTIFNIDITERITL
jgi:hypothetical protein